jgi:hypothetical protein
MYELSIKDINYLAGEVRNSGITYSHLLDDLIDHVCCDVEYEMKQGLPFEKAYEKVKQKIGFEGLHQIQDDTLYLIDKNYRTMKKTMRIFGVLSPILMALGAVFKIMHWPTASILLVLGFFFMTCFFLPSAIYVSYKEISQRTRKWTYIVGFIGTFFLTVSFLFKVMHWPGASIALVSGAFFTCFIFLPSLLIHKLKESETVVPKYVFVIAYIGFISQLVGFTFKIMHWPGASLLFLSGIILFVFITLPIYVFKRYKEKSSVEGSFIYIILAVAWFILPTTLLSLNVSRQILNANIETESVMIADIKFMQGKNNLLIKALSENAPALRIKNDADNLINYLQQIKVDMIKQTEGDRANMVINDQKEIDIFNLSDPGNTGACAKLLQHGKVNELYKFMHSLKDEMLACSHQKSCLAFIKETLPDKLNEEIFPDPSIMISSLNNLSFLQLNVLKAENALFEEMMSGHALAKIETTVKK